MHSNFFEITVSTYNDKKEKQYSVAPFFQLLSSLASPISKETELYNEVKNIVNNFGKTKASNLLKTQKQICFVKNIIEGSSKPNISNLDISLFVILAIENQYSNNSLSIERINKKYCLDRNDYRRQIAKLQNLNFSVYKFSEKEFYDQLPVFDYLYQDGLYIDYKFSDFFNGLILASGKTYMLPFSMLTSQRIERNAIYSLGQLFLSINNSSQKQIKSDEFYEFETTFSLKDFYEFCGIEFKDYRLDSLKDYTFDMLNAFITNFDIKSIKIGAQKVFGYNEFLPPSNQLFEAKKYFKSKKIFFNSILSIIFEQKDLPDV
ncbi:MAG: hypothetical protein IJT79_05980 [Ruminococcus sp.]|nr:hypothetical protein [Ruminococcus sp.]